MNLPFFKKITSRFFKGNARAISAPQILTLAFLLFAGGLLTYAYWNYYSEQPTTRDDERGWIGVSTPHLRLGDDRIIMLSSTDEPSVQLTSYNTSGEVDITFYDASVDTLLQFLTYNEDGQRTTQKTDVSSLNEVATTKHSLESRKETSKLALPIQESGMLLVRASAQSEDETKSVTEDFLVVRSNFGVLTKESEKELVFWGQSFDTLKSITGGSIHVYNLEDGSTLLEKQSFSEEGVARTKLTKEADIALAFYNDAVSVILINLQANSDHGIYHQYFHPNEPEKKHFIFTDRPLYRPGDTIYFKAILRNDNDARYTVPRGQAEVELWNGRRGGSRSELLEKKTIPISSQGSIDGQFELAEDASTGEGYRLVVKSAPIDSDRGTTTTFQVEHFRKPEHKIDAEVNKNEFVAGEKAIVTVSGNYFSGQPLSGKTVKYTVRASDFYSYSRYSSQARTVSDEYRYGYWRYDEVKKGEVTLDKFGKAYIEIETSDGKDAYRDKVFSFEASYKGDAGNPSFARKNILVHRGGYDIFQDDSDHFQYSVSAGTNYRLPIILVSREGGTVQNIQLTTDIQHEQWVRGKATGVSFLRYKKETKTLPPMRITTDTEGKAVLSFTPQEAGSYEIKITGKDAAGNEISKGFFTWARDEGKPLYSDRNERDGQGTLTLRTNKQEYKPDETATLFISSTSKDRDVFVSFERGYMHRFKIVSIDDALTALDIPLQESDVPNIFAKISGFSGSGYETVSENMSISAESKRIIVDIETDSEIYGPGEVATVTVRTTDINGLPVSAETAVWAVDKALFELVDERPHDIFRTFWRKRSNRTQEAHSLQGLTIYGAEMGGCFTEDTPILMKGNSTKTIKEVKVGDTVLTKKDAHSNTLVEAKVTGKQAHEVSGYLIINGHMRITPEHILYVNGEWTEAGNIQVGDLLVNQDSASVPVTSVEWQAGSVTVYNLEIEKYHTFIADSIWVHNEKGGGNGGPRSLFKDTAYWNPQVRTNTFGVAQVRFVLPDNLTTWVISSLGSTPSTRVGNARDEITVTKDVIVRPILPNVLREGDDLMLSALVQNFTGEDHTFITALDFDSGDVRKTQERNERINADSTATKHWDVYPRTPKPEAALTFSAQAADDSTAADTVIKKIPVKALGFVDRHVETGVDAQTYSINLVGQNNADETNITVSLAPSVLGTLPEAMKYLVDYPYGCVEQTTSRLVPSIIAQSEPALFAEALEGKDIEAIIGKGLKRLRQLQNSNGGWGWWHGTTDPFVTAYVVEYLKLAQDLGFKVSPDMLTGAKHFFERTIESKPYSFREKNPQAYVSAMYALSILGSDKASVISIDSITEMPDLLAMAVMNNYLLGNRDADTNGLNQLVSQAKRQGSHVYWERGAHDRFGSKDASTALALRALIASESNQPLMVKAAQYLAINRQHGYWSNTFGTAQSMHAIAEYSRYAEEVNTDYSYVISLDGKEISRGQVTDFKQKISNSSIPGDTIKRNGSRLTITKNGEGKLYSTVTINEFRTDLENAQKSHGLSISRSYENETSPGKPFRVGDTVKVKLAVKGFKEGGQYAVIEDELPSGLVPINESFKNEQYDNYDRSNRWRWYGREITENGMILSLRWISSKNKTYEYRARVVAEGRFMAPPARVEMMYDPTTYAQSSFYEFRTEKFLDD